MVEDLKYVQEAKVVVLSNKKLQEDYAQLKSEVIDVKF